MKFLGIVFLAFLLGCQTAPKNPQPWMEREINACLPTAIAFRQALKESNVWAEVLTYKYYSPKFQRVRGHAFVAYLYPPGTNQLWTYDNQGSYRTRAYITSVDGIAKQGHLQRLSEGIFRTAKWVR